MAAVATAPGLSQLMAWPTEHLSDAAEHWEAVAERNYGLANQVWRDAASVDWQGNAADALRTATHSDMTATGAAADQLHTAAKVARTGASDLYAARSRLMYAIEDAQTAGFDVEEEGSVVDRATGGSATQRAVRQAQAETLAANIRQRAAQLVATDQQVAGKVTAAVAGVRDALPQNPTLTPLAPPPRKPTIRAVDNHTFKQEPAPSDPGGESPWENRLPPKTLDDVRDALQQLQRGRNAPHRELETPEEIKKFYEWLTGNSVGNLPPFGFPRRQLEDGTVIEMRPNSSSGGPVIEVKPPGAKQGPKVHLPLPFVDDPPQLPPILDHPPSTPLPAGPAHPLPAPPGPTQFADPADLPPWLRDPSPPGFTISPLQQPPAFGWDGPDPAPPPTASSGPSSSGGQSFLPETGHDLAEGGKAVFGWVVVGGVLMWTLLSGAGQGGAATP